MTRQISSGSGSTPTRNAPDLFYGGAAGPGKTSFLLMAAVQYVHYPHYRALDTSARPMPDLSLPDALNKAISVLERCARCARFNNQEKRLPFQRHGAKSLSAN